MAEKMPEEKLNPQLDELASTLDDLVDSIDNLIGQVKDLCSLLRERREWQPQIKAPQD